MKRENSYTKMQLNHYNKKASLWSKTNRNPVVGSYDKHNNWKGYDNLFDGLENLKEKDVLDFACGPGRNLVKYSNIFKSIDGVDISPINIEKAREQLKDYNILNSNLFVCDGVSLNSILSEKYDIVMSTIALQHICVHEIRYNIFKEIFRVLKLKGVFTFQMGFGKCDPRRKHAVDYYANYYEAKSTNGGCDVQVESPDQLEKDLKEIGFSDFKFKITKTGPGDRHPNWIFCKSIKKYE